FFFSSRRRHTRSKRDWSSDVCSSDLRLPIRQGLRHEPLRSLSGSSRPLTERFHWKWKFPQGSGPLLPEKSLRFPGPSQRLSLPRSEERRVGKGGGSGRSMCDEGERRD